VTRCGSLAAQSDIKTEAVQRMISPRTPAEWSAYRCQLSCKIGCDALEGKAQPPPGRSPLEYAVFNLLHAVEDLSRQSAATKGNQHE
jgi:hypothetical protein